MTRFVKDPPTSLDRAGFLARYGGAYEHSPWIAAAVWDAGETADGVEALADAMARRVDAADAAAKLALLRAHPDLAGRLAVRGEMTAESAAEQTGAGLDRCSPAEFSEFQELNARYRTRFGFPFILAVRGHDRQSILAAFRRRIDNSRADEIREALGQVHRIARLRLLALAAED